MPTSDNPQRQIDGQRCKPERYRQHCGESVGYHQCKATHASKASESISSADSDLRSREQFLRIDAFSRTKSILPPCKPPNALVFSLALSKFTFTIACRAGVLERGRL